MNELYQDIVNAAIEVLLQEPNKALNKRDLLRKVQRSNELFDWLDPGNLVKAVDASDQITVDGNVISIIATEDAIEQDVAMPVQDTRELFPGRWLFYDNEDVQAFNDWAEKLLSNYLRKRNATDKEEARAIKDKIDALCTQEAPLPVHEVEEVWEDLEEFNNGEDGDANRLQKGITWGEWRVHLERVSDEYNINGAPVKLIYPAQDTTTIHEYRRRPGKLKWPLLKVEQNENTYFLSVAPIKEIDAVCAVPDLPETMTSKQTAHRILNPSIGQSEWQRQLNVRRREAIMQFMENSENIIANAPILFVADSNHINVTSTAVEISMDFLEQQNIQRQGVADRVYRDVRVDSQDMRPLWLIDGQHRIRGGAGSTKGREVNVPIIIFPSELSLEKTAKIFAEINTLQEPLDSLHQLFMQHRFNIPSPKAKSDFGLDETGQPRNQHSRANHWAYELAAKLCEDSQSPLYGRIQLLKQNHQRGHVIDGKQWLDFSHAWMKSVYSESSDIPFATVVEEVGNYFKAIRHITRHAYPTRPGWDSDLNNQSLIQRKSPFVALLLCYPAARRAALIEEANMNEGIIPDNPIGELAFQMTLAPWKNVDWHDDDLKNRFGASGESPRRSLLAWLECALEAEEPATKGEIHTDRHESIPGQGIFAKPAKSTIVITGDSWMTRSGQQLQFYSERPVNALPTCRWELQSATGEEIKSQSVPASESRRSFFKLQHSPLWDRETLVVLVAKWDNVNGTSTTKITLQRNG